MLARQSDTANSSSISNHFWSVHEWHARSLLSWWLDTPVPAIVRWVSQLATCTHRMRFFFNIHGAVRRHLNQNHNIFQKLNSTGALSSFTPLCLAPFSPILQQLVYEIFDTPVALTKTRVIFVACRVLRVSHPGCENMLIQQLSSTWLGHTAFTSVFWHLLYQDVIKPLQLS